MQMCLVPEPIQILKVVNIRWYNSWNNMYEQYIVANFKHKIVDWWNSYDFLNQNSRIGFL